MLLRMRKSLEPTMHYWPPLLVAFPAYDCSAPLRDVFFAEGYAIWQQLGIPIADAGIHYALQEVCFADTPPELLYAATP